jgi:hypothetical protein
MSPSYGIGETTACTGTKENMCMGEEANRKTWPRSRILYRRPKVTQSMYKKLVSTSRNLVRNTPSPYRFYSIFYGSIKTPTLVEVGGTYRGR